MATFVVDVVPLKCQDSVLKKIINRNFRELLDSGLLPHTYPLSEPEYTGQALFDDLVEYVYMDDTSYLYNKYDYEQIRDFVLSCGVTPECILNWVKNLLKTHKVVRALSIVFENEKEHKTKKISKKIKESYLETLNGYKENSELYCIEISQEDAENFNYDNEEMIWAVRSKYGDFPVKFYKTLFSEDPIIKYIVRYQYAINTLCNYYEVREILYKDWVKLDEEHKKATCN